MTSAKLTALKVKRLTANGRYSDGANLWLQVRDARHKSWIFRYTIAGKQRLMGLGSYPDVSLAEARDKAATQRKLMQAGADPVDERKRARAAAAPAVITFKEVCDLYLKAHEGGWKPGRHHEQWRRGMEIACKSIGSKPVGEVSVGDVLSVLEPMWHVTPDTASKLRGRMEAVLDYASSRQWRSGENPARWRGGLKNLLAPPKKLKPVKHFAALNYRQMPEFMRALRADDTVGAWALEYVILCASRAGEATNARWGEINASLRLWVVPPARM